MLRFRAYRLEHSLVRPAVRGDQRLAKLEPRAQFVCLAGLGLAHGDYVQKFH
jgi:hypothetical protein